MIEERIVKLGLVLPEAPAPVASYVPVVCTGNLLFISGQIPFKDGDLPWKGLVGRDVSVKDGQEAARTCILNALAVIKKELGSLDKIERIVRLSGFIACAPDFFQQPQVINGASDLLVEIFGERGKHSRVALGVASLPLNAPVEIDIICEIR